MFKSNRCCERPMNYANDGGFKYYSESTMAMDYPQAMPSNNMAMGMMPHTDCPPIYECPQERVCHKEFVHEVSHIVPINTRVINHHIYRHTFTPCYTCCEENEVCNVYDGCCNKF